MCRTTTMVHYVMLGVPKRAKLSLKKGSFKTFLSNVQHCVRLCIVVFIYKSKIVMSNRLGKIRSTCKIGCDDFPKTVSALHCLHCNLIRWASNDLTNLPIALYENITGFWSIYKKRHHNYYRITVHENQSIEYCYVIQDIRFSIFLNPNKMPTLLQHSYLEAITI